MAQHLQVEACFHSHTIAVSLLPETEVQSGFGSPSVLFAQ
jgi:hypothetical protein